MQFLTYWKIAEDFSVRQTQEVANELTEGGLFPPEGVELVRWDGTPDGWGVVIMEADDYESINETLNLWRAAAGEAAFFEETRTAPAAPVQEIIPQQSALLERLE